MLRKLFPFLFKKESQSESPTAAPKPAEKQEGKKAETPAANVYGLIGRNKSHRGLRKGSKVYVRQIFDDGERLRVRGTAPNGKKVTLTVNRRALKQYESEGVPDHLTKHYKAHSLFDEEHEAKMKAEAFNKRH
ncbi:MAG: hypothetical protein AAGN35_09855 [Bacteroidota bacterium]